MSNVGADVDGDFNVDFNDEEQEYTCYENFTVYHPVFESAQFWIEGVLLIVVGILGILGNGLTLVVLGNSKKTNFHQLLIVLSVTDTLLVRLALENTKEKTAQQPAGFEPTAFKIFVMLIVVLSTTINCICIVTKRHYYSGT